MWLVLGSPTDASARWAYEGLKARGLAPLRWVSPECLGQGKHWEHRLGKDGVETEIAFHDGTRICSKEVAGALNRLQYIPQEPLSLAHPQDLDYANQEWYALFTSWVHSLARCVINRPAPQGLCGRWRHRAEWAWLAAQAGLPTAAYRQSSDDIEDGTSWRGRLVPDHAEIRTVIVMQGRLFGATLPERLHAGCKRFAELAETQLLGIDFAPAPEDEWIFAGATPLPDLEVGGDCLLDALAFALTN